MSDLAKEIRSLTQQPSIQAAGLAQLLGRVAAVLQNQEDELTRLRVELDGWKQYFKLRRDVSEIETHLKPLLAALKSDTLLVPEVEAIAEVVERIVGREI